MRFEFKPSENSISFKEYLSYLIKTSECNTLYIKTILPASIIFIFSIFTFLLIEDYKIFPYMIIGIIAALVVYILIILLIIKLVKRKQKKSIKNNNLYCDIESTFYFIIEDGYLIRENEFSNLKLPLNKLKDVKLLKNGLILSIEGRKLSLFIPKDRLPVTVEEFIALIKEENNDLIVIEGSKRSKKLFKKISIILTITFISACIFSFFIAKYDYEHNFKKYDLVMWSNLNKQDNNTYLYENENLGVSLVFPSKWEGKFGIEEKYDRINVYYLANGKQSNNTNLLFSIRGLSAFWEEIYLNIIRTEGLYLFTGPTKISLEKDSKEHLEYLELYKDIKNVHLR